SRHLNQVRFERGSGFEEPLWPDGQQHQRRHKVMQVGLAAGKTSEEARAPWKQRYGPGFFLRRCLPERTGNKSSKSEKQRYDGRAPSQSAKATAQRDEYCGPFHKSSKKLILVLKSSLGEPLGPVKLGSCKMCLERYLLRGCAGNFPGNMQAVPRRGRSPESRTRKRQLPAFSTFSTPLFPSTVSRGILLRPSKFDSKRSLVPWNGLPLGTKRLTSTAKSAPTPTPSSNRSVRQTSKLTGVLKCA